MPAPGLRWPMPKSEARHCWREPRTRSPRKLSVPAAAPFSVKVQEKVAVWCPGTSIGVTGLDVIAAAPPGLPCAEGVPGRTWSAVASPVLATTSCTVNEVPRVIAEGTVKASTLSAAGASTAVPASCWRARNRKPRIRVGARRLRRPGDGRLRAIRFVRAVGEDRVAAAGDALRGRRREDDRSPAGSACSAGTTPVASASPALMTVTLNAKACPLLTRAGGAMNAASAAGCCTLSAWLCTGAADTDAPLFWSSPDAPAESARAPEPRLFDEGPGERRGRAARDVLRCGSIGRGRRRAPRRGNLWHFRRRRDLDRDGFAGVPHRERR